MKRNMLFTALDLTSTFSISVKATSQRPGFCLGAAEDQAEGRLKEGSCRVKVKMESRPGSESASAGTR